MSNSRSDVKAQEGSEASVSSAYRPSMSNKRVRYDSNQRAGDHEARELSSYGG